jgi:DNA topoisomerase I
MKTLVIVESPTKAKTISKFLGNEYILKFSMDHIMDLPKSKIGIDFDHDFAPQYEIIPEKKQMITEFKKIAQKASVILLATDPDREGEAIASHIKDVLGSHKSKGIKQKLQRIVFHEITESAIKKALQNPRAVDAHLVDAQTARRVLDRIVGYKISPILWKKVRRGLSAGRVQSVALRLIVERQKVIEQFGKEEYFTIHGLFEHNSKIKTKKKETEFTLLEINRKKIDVIRKLTLYDGEYTYAKTVIDTERKAQEISDEINKQSYIVGDVLSREMKRSPYPPFTTSTLQQQAATRYGFPGKRTMSLAQKLYEEGFITYHRTDSVTLSPVAIKQIREYIFATYGEGYLPKQERQYVTKQKNAQEAHEAIRPTDVARKIEIVKDRLGDSYAKLYDLIWNRAVASHMSDAKIESTAIVVDSLPKEKGSDVYRFKATGSVLLFDGFLKLTPQALEDKQLPKFIKGEQVMLRSLRIDEHETTPPPRYNDASLIKTLEEKGIGRPSTYASIIATITDRGYIERIDRKFVPTAVGIAVNDFLVKNFSTIDDIPFTAGMEDDLDLVASGVKEWHTMMQEFYTPFAQQLQKVESAERVKIAVEETDEHCPLCGEGKIVVRTGKFGKFFSCSRFPDCRFTKPYSEQTDVLCPKDGGKIIIKKTRKGRKFFGCSNYPNCDFAAWKLEDIKKAQINH